MNTHITILEAVLIAVVTIVGYAFFKTILQHIKHK
jgi:hypothetical protein